MYTKGMCPISLEKGELSKKGHYLGLVTQIVNGFSVIHFVEAFIDHFIGNIIGAKKGGHFHYKSRDFSKFHLFGDLADVVKIQQPCSVDSQPFR